MKITKAKLKQIIKEELGRIQENVSEHPSWDAALEMYVDILRNKKMPTDDQLTFDLYDLDFSELR